MISTSSSLNLQSFTINLPKSHQISYNSTKHIKEIYLLQALLNQDFERFSSNENSEFFSDKNVLLIYSKNEVRIIINDKWFSKIKSIKN